ncbi:MAG: phosphoribosyltransferase family protein [Crocinitomicaceae bacterium]|jgi:ComF family protein|nr:phosphoribosyltransferase family protein [Crocinitomicaceae bacterium]
MSLLPTFKELLFHGLYPNICLLCDQEISDQSTGICVLCKNDLPFTFIAENSNKNPVKELLRYRIDIREGYSLLYFEKQTDSQHLLHELKYRDKAQLGLELGRMMGTELANTEWIKTVDCICPVPLHPKKEFIRGYNQSALLARGLSETLSLPLHENLLKRKLHQESQTKQNRFDRHGHIEHTFCLAQKSFRFQHLVLVDDVITTGATLERIATLLRQVQPDLEISIVTLALAKG